MKNLIDRAKKFAEKKHNMPADAQKYGNNPYSYHLKMVADVAKRYIHNIAESDRDNVVSACWTHDTIEDTDASGKQIKNMFNEVVADIVMRVTNERGFDKKEVLFKTLPKIWQSELATFVKMCDRIANGHTSKNGDSEKSKRMYIRYCEEYPIFRYALKKEQYLDMWNELDEIFEYEPIK